MITSIVMPNKNCDECLFHDAARADRKHLNDTGSIKAEQKTEGRGQ
jgi:hypothetical protein